MSRRVVLGLVTVVSVAVGGFIIAVVVRKGLAQAALWAGLLGTLAAIVAAAAAVLAVPRPVKVPLPPELEVPDWVIDRPAELAAVVKALVGGGVGMVGITTGLYGAGGFGKTTLAQMVCADRQVRRRFGGRVYLVTVGRDTRGAAAVAARVNDVIKLVTGENATFTNPQDAGRRLGSLLDAGPRRLLVLDDVWEGEQLAPFTEGGKQCARLVTTRVPGLLGRSVAVRVDQMSPEQARALLTAGLPQLDPSVVRGLLAVTGRWPLLLRLVNKILTDYANDYARIAADVSAKGAELLEQLRAGGPAVIDDVIGNARRGLDVGQQQERDWAVRATIEASTRLLDRNDAERFAELGVFAEDEAIPFSLVAQLWQTTAGLKELQAAQVCKRLSQLALVSQAVGSAGAITLHDVIREFERAELGQQRLAALNSRLLDAIAANLPAASRLQRDTPGRRRVAWWELGDEDRYLWDHLIEHLVDAGRRGEAEAVASDLRWVGARLTRLGPAAPAADLSAAGTPRADQLRAVLARASHLLAPSEPAGAVVDVLHSRVAHDSHWGPQVAALRDICPRPRLVNRWPLPDLADPALRRVVAGHDGRVAAAAVAPDGSWLATGGADGTVRIWDLAIGGERTPLAGHIGGVRAVAVAPDGTWLATGSEHGTVRIWDAATGQERSSMTGHAGGVTALAVAPDSTWLATGGADGTVRIWDPATGREQASLACGAVAAVAVAPDGSWLATGGRNGKVRIWDLATRRERVSLKGHFGWVAALAVAPDGSWLASGGADGTVQIWDVSNRRKRAHIDADTMVRALTVAPDGRGLAYGGKDGIARIWDLAAGKERSSMAGHADGVTALAVAPDGSWLATGSGDGIVRIWDATTEGRHSSMAGHARGVTALVVAPDGSWLATGSGHGTVRIWDLATGREQVSLACGGVAALAVAPDGSWLATGGADGTVQIWRRSLVRAPTVRLNLLRRTKRPPPAATSWETSAGLAGHAGGVAAVAVAPDGSWLATGGADGTVRIWDLATKRERSSMAGHAGRVAALAVAPDGTWLATGGADGTVRIWDLATKRERSSMAGHAGGVAAVTVAPDGNWLATGGADGTVRIWDTAGRARAMMRLDGSVNASAWLSANALAVGGPAGPYLFDFLTEAVSATAPH